MQEEQEERQGKEQKEPEEDRPVEEAEDPSLVEEQAEEEAEPLEEDEEESEPVEGIEDEHLIEEEPPRRRGCLRGCLMPIAAIFVVCLAAVVILHAKWENAVSMWLRQRIIAYTQDRVLSNLPEGMDEREIEASFEKVRIALREGRIDEETLDETIDEYLDAIRNRPPPEQERQAILTLVTGLNTAVMGSDQ